MSASYKQCPRCEAIHQEASFFSKAKPAIICKWCSSCRAKEREYTRKVHGHTPWEKFVHPDGWCCGCQQVLTIDSFYVAPSQNRGYSRMCKVCTSKRNKIHNKLHKEKLQSSEEGREILRRYKKHGYDNIMKDPSRKKKLYAQLKLQRYVREKKIAPQPCERCGDSQVHGHHPNYDEPLNVVWLCRIHHEEVHLATPSLSLNLQP